MERDLHLVTMDLIVKRIERELNQLKNLIKFQMSGFSSTSTKCDENTGDSSKIVDESYCLVDTVKIENDQIDTTAEDLDDVNNYQIEINEAQVNSQNRRISVDEELILGGMNFNSEISSKKDENEAQSSYLVCDQGIKYDENPLILKSNLAIKYQKSKISQKKTDGKTNKISSKSKNSKKKSCHICSYCKKTFDRSENLSNHMRVHTGERPFKCKICSKSFNISENLKRHSRTHTGEKSFSCSICLRSFGYKSNLKDHMKIHTGEKPYSCSVCSKPFAQNSDLDKHMRIHTGEKPYSCSICSKSFTQNAHLRGHKKTHKGFN